MNSVLLAISTMLWINFRILIPWLPTPKEPIPVIQMEREPAGADASRIITDEWMDCQLLQKDFYDPNHKTLEWAADFDAQMDVIANKLKAHPVGQRALFEWHCFSSPYESSWTTLLNQHDNGCKDADGNFVTYTDFNSQVRPYTCPFDFSAGAKVGYEKWKHLLQALKTRNVPLDYFVTENEQGMSYWGINTAYSDAIKHDPRFPAFAAALGFSNIETFDHDHILKLNAELGRRTTQLWMDSVYKAMLEIYPNLKGKIFDYAKFQIKEPYHAFDFNGWEFWKYTEPFVNFVTNSPDMGLECAQLCTANSQFATTGPFPRNNWNEFVYAYNLAAATALSNPNGYFWPLLGPTSFHHDNHFYKELFIHMTLMGAVGHVFWNPKRDKTIAAYQREFGHMPTDPEFATWVAGQTAMELNDYVVLNSSIDEVRGRLDFADRKTQVKSLMGWQDTQVKSCAIANKKQVCRVTKSDGTGSWTTN